MTWHRFAFYDDKTQRNPRPNKVLYLAALTYNKKIGHESSLDIILTLDVDILFLHIEKMYHTRQGVSESYISKLIRLAMYRTSKYWHKN